MQSIKERKYFADPQSGALNADDAAFVVGENQWINASNVRTGTTDAGVTGVMECIGSTRLLSTPQPSITFITIGTVDDIPNNRFIYFKYCTTAPWHKIVAFDTINEVEYDVLLSSQVEGGLNFSKDYPIHSARVVNGLLYWTDNYNEPKKINIDSGIKTNNPSYVTDAEAYATPLTYEMTTIIKRPPQYVANFEKLVDATTSVNNIATEAFQFCYRYYFKDGEYSVFSPYSITANLNQKNDQFNYIQVSMSFSEVIQDDVQSVELIVRYLSNDSNVVVKTWDKNLAADLAEIESHNDGLIALTYDFYNDTVGAFIDAATASKPFESVPLLCESLEVAKNRLDLSNNLLGYNPPLQTSLSLTAVENPSGSDILGVIWEIRYIQYGTGNEMIKFFIYLSGISVPGYYSHTYTAPPYPSTIPFSSLTYKSAIIEQDLIDDDGMITYAEPTGETTTITGASPLALEGLPIFKTNTVYKAGVVFYDRFRRKCGYVTNDNFKLKIDPRTYGSLNQTVNIAWALSNTNALLEIPEFAYYYQPVLSKNLTTSFFIQSRANEITYVIKNPTTGAYTYSHTYADTNYGIALKAENLFSYGIGYSYSEGDLATLYIDGTATPYNAKVIGQDGSYIFVSLINLLSLTGVDALFDIYTPIRVSSNTPLYEVGQVFSVNDPTTTARSYGTISGLFQPDSYALLRGTSPDDYLAEAMSPNDDYYQQWNTNAGFVNYFDAIGQRRLENSIAFSNVIVDETRTNGLSSFEALNLVNIPVEAGAIRKLQLTSKVNNESGVVMLAICEKETASIYVGEVQLVGQNANANLVQTNDYIGTVNILKGSFGTINPESVVEFRGNVYWLDASNGKYIQYSASGLFPISNFKMTKYWKLFCDQYLSMTASEIEALGSRPFVFSTVDPYHSELLITVPKLLETPPSGYLPDYPATIYPFNIWDGQGKTIVYKIGQGQEQPHWQGSYSFEAENFMSFQNKLYSFKYGHLYIHNQIDSFCNFYGTQYTAKVMCVSNMQGNVPKVYENIMVEGNLKPNFVYFYNRYPIQQSSDLTDENFRDYEGLWNSFILRNKLVPTATGYTTDGLMTGEKLRNVAMNIMLEWNVSTQQLQLKFVTVGFSISRGYGQ